jgi:predicted glycogen debranching enzyme
MRLPSISLDRAALSNFESSIRKEWLVTNGLGGYASSTVLGINTRKYHGLLIAALHPPRDRRVFLSKLDEEIVLGDSAYQFGANEFQSVIFPRGFDFLQEFSISPFPKYVYLANDVTVQKAVLMPYEKNCVIATYSISNKSSLEAKIRVWPLVSWRPFHSVTDRWKASDFSQEQNENIVKLSFSTPKATLLLAATGGGCFSAGKWIERLYFREEASRGESCFDDCYQLGYFEISTSADKTKDFAIVVVADEEESRAEKVLKEIPFNVSGLSALLEKETRRFEDEITEFYGSHENIPASNWLEWLVLAAGAFITKGINYMQKSVIAGYHWFGEWGRDTFVSLPGLMLVTGRFEEARAVFLEFAKYYDRGLIPNFLPDQVGPASYNTVDATLWYTNAVLQYLKYTGDFAFVKQHLWQALESFIEEHVEGTLFDIHVDSDGLLCHGPQLTWMDAAVNNEPVTPRLGKAVEVQALWYNSLKTMESLANRFGEGGSAEEYGHMAEAAQKSFISKFWNTQRGSLYDVVSEHELDASLRPNQIIAVSLDFTMLDHAKNQRIVDVVHDELLTPGGLRTLARNDPRYVGVYSGDRASRDRAYHNGTVWPWLLGPLTTAFLKVKGYEASQREYAFQNFLMPLLTQKIFEAGLGTLAEIFDGEPPHTPRGCIAQAWSVAEPLRAYVEDYLRVRPEYEKKVLQSSV